MKYIQVEITREQSATLYLEVPDDFKRVTREMVQKAAAATIKDFEWESYDSPIDHSIDYQSWSEIDKGDVACTYYSMLGENK